MKNALPELIFTREIHNEKPEPKTFYKFLTTIEEVISSNEIVLDQSIRLKLINQPKSDDVSTLKPKDNVLVFGQVVEEKSLIEGQIRKITMEQALKYDMLMKKLKSNSYLQQNKFSSHLNSTSENDYNTSSVIGPRNGGFYEHF